jgi:hypothetical protein
MKNTPPLFAIIFLVAFIYSFIRSHRKWKTLLYGAWAFVTTLSILMLSLLLLSSRLRVVHLEWLGAVFVDLALLAAALLSLFHCLVTRNVAKAAGAQHSASPV